MSGALVEKVDAIARQMQVFNAAGKSVFATSSFQTHSIPMLHILSQHAKPTKVFFIQTGYHFPETLSFRDRVARDFGLNLANVESDVPKIQQRNGQGNLYFTSDPDYCCYMNKTQPVGRLLLHYDVWMNGVRADQNANRGKMKVMEETSQGAMRYHPMLHWSKQEIWEYIRVYNLPRHPLDAQGYISIGCMPCTEKPSLNEEREGRWSGQRKTECGLHTELIKK